MTPFVTERLHIDERLLPSEVFERFAKRGNVRRDRQRARELAWENFGKPGRDPAGLASVLGDIAKNGVWIRNMKLAQLRNHWDQVVGEGIALHSVVASFADGVLIIRAESTVWATQLTYLIPQLTDTIRQRMAGLDIRQIKVTGPASGYRHAWVK